MTENKIQLQKLIYLKMLVPISQFIHFLLSAICRAALGNFALQGIKESGPSSSANQRMQLNYFVMQTTLSLSARNKCNENKLKVKNRCFPTIIKITCFSGNSSHGRQVLQISLQCTLVFF